VTAALDWVRGFTCTNEVLQRLDPVAAERALQRLRQTLAAHAAAERAGRRNTDRPPCTDKPKGSWGLA
jgi:hypothetical protein